MKKIFKFITGTIKVILGNLDYIAAFALGALAQVHYPELLADVSNYVVNFDLAAAFDATKDFFVGLFELGKDAVAYVESLIAKA